MKAAYPSKASIPPRKLEQDGWLIFRFHRRHLAQICAAEDVRVTLSRDDVHHGEESTAPPRLPPPLPHAPPHPRARLGGRVGARPLGRRRREPLAASRAQGEAPRVERRARVRGSRAARRRRGGRARRRRGHRASTPRDATRGGGALRLRAGARGPGRGPSPPRHRASR